MYATTIKTRNEDEIAHFFEEWRRFTFRWKEITYGWLKGWRKYSDTELARSGMPKRICETVKRLERSKRARAELWIFSIYDGHTLDMWCVRQWIEVEVYSEPAHDDSDAWVRVRIRKIKTERARTIWAANTDKPFPSEQAIR